MIVLDEGRRTYGTVNSSQVQFACSINRLVWAGRGRFVIGQSVRPSHSLETRCRAVMHDIYARQSLQFVLPFRF